MSKLAGKVAIVTGASRGIGRAIAERLSADGANVVVNFASSQAAADKVVASLPTKSIAVKADVAREDACKALVQAAMDEFGRIDILVLNAGVLTNETLDQITSESFDRSFAINVKGPLLLTKLSHPHMAPGSRVIFFSSSLTSASTVTPNYALYNATKGAVEQLSRTLAKDLGKKGICVNTVSPGPTATELFKDGKSQQQLDFFAGLSPFGRLGEPADIASVVSFLAGPDSAWVSGQNIRVNGGFVV
ncbi:hypothetical protein HK101_008553 [Irineochytrium annulatum]|nr:hypothetical protein HK101_008553 [Irineochytrium annulatum]